MKLLSRLTYSFFTASLLTVAACGGDADPASFSKATDVQKQRAVIAGGGMDAGIAFLFGSILSSAPPEQACPKATTSGDTVTITTNCTSENGDKLSGTITAKNVGGFFGGNEADPTKPQVVTFDGFAIDDTSDDNEDVAIDGEVTLGTDGSLKANLDVTLAGILVHSDATWKNANGLQSADAGSSIEIDGLGAADIKGSWNMSDDAPAGVLELHGADVLKADFGAMVNDCVPLTVDGKAAGQLCGNSDTE